VRRLQLRVALGALGLGLVALPVTAQSPFDTAATAPPATSATSDKQMSAGPMSRVSGGYTPTEEGARIERLLDEWRFAEGEAALKNLARSKAGNAEVLYLEGYTRFLSGDYPTAVLKLRAALEQAPDDVNIKSVGALAAAAGKAIEGHKESRSRHFVLRFPPEDEVLAEYALEALETALGNLSSDLGFAPNRPIHVDIYRSPSDLAAVSTLTEAEVERTGTIALCKWARLMATSPRALSYGYPWLDSLSHELVHYVVSALSRDQAPVWFQEGLAKFLERRWRDPPSANLPPVMQHLLAKALASNKLIGFDRMHPSMAKLPTAEDASLAFAEVVTAVASLHAQGGTGALRTAISGVRDGLDARTAVARPCLWPGPRAAAGRTSRRAGRRSWPPRSTRRSRAWSRCSGSSASRRPSPASERRPRTRRRWGRTRPRATCAWATCCCAASAPRPRPSNTRRVRS
jgi:tetratricopeptide (TPR) repeat protein